MEKEIFLPTLHWFAMTNTFSGSCGDFRFMAKPNVIMATPKEVDFAQSSITCAFWHGKLCYVAMKCGFSEMCWALVALGIYDAIKLDGGGSFILHDVKELEGTSENRRIHNVGVWT